MARTVLRRDVLRGTAALAGLALTGGLLSRKRALAASLQVPTIDKLSMQVLLDSSHDIFMRPSEVKGVAHQPPGAGRGADYRRTLHNQWGLSLYLQSEIGGAQRTLMLDFGYSPEALVNNIEILKVDPSRIEALIVSHGHYDHFGGLLGFLSKYRSVLPPAVTLYAGGEDNFCHRYGGAPGQLTDFGMLDRRELTAQKLTTVLCEKPTLIGGHAFTTGTIERRSIERVLPNSLVEFALKDGAGCDAKSYLAADKVGKIVRDEHLHEHATCFNLKGRGLIVISSCGHVGIVNSVRQAQHVSGIERVHAIVGGFHLGPAPKEYLGQVVDELAKLTPDVVIPMHCSGANFIQAVREKMPDNLLVPTTGSRLTFSA